MKYNVILAELRKSKGSTLREVAQAIGVSPSTIAMYERGDRVPKDDVKVRLATYYKRSVASIFFAK